MAQIRSIGREGVLQKVASAGFIIGVLLLIVFNILSPRPEDPNSIQSALTTMSDQKVLTQLSQLILLLGIWLVMLGITSTRPNPPDR